LSQEVIQKNWIDNPTLKPKINKVVVNMCIGKSGAPLEKAEKILSDLTGQLPCKRQAKKTIREFGIRKGEPISCMVTLRNKRALKFLTKVMPVISNRLSANSFDKQGNISFGIHEHIEIPGVKYDPDIGIFGMDVCISLNRIGYRVKRRKRQKNKIGSKQLLTLNDAKTFVMSELGVEVY